MVTQKGLLTETDLVKIGNLIDAKLEVKLEQKLEEKLEQKFDEKLAGYATKNDFAKLRQDMLGDKSEILAAINKKDENDAGHKMLHDNLGEDVPRLAFTQFCVVSALRSPWRAPSGSGAVSPGRRHI